MESFGDFFPGNPQSLDELLEQFAAQMAAVQAVLDSMSPEQRAQLQALAESLFEDLNLRWQVDRLAENLRRAVPQAGWGRSYRFSGADPMGLADAAAAARRIGEMDRLAEFLRSASSPGALAEVDLEQVEKYLGDDAARSLDSLARLAKELEEAGLIEQREGRYELTALGIRRIGQRALTDLFSKLAKDRLGGHSNTWVGTGHELEGQTKPYEFGDPFVLDIQRTVHNAVRRSGGGTPVQPGARGLRDLAYRAPHPCVDRSHGRPFTVHADARQLSRREEGRYRAAHADLHAIPRDFLGLVGFSEVAREIRAEELPEVSWDFVYGTNMQHGLMLSRRMLAHRAGTKQIIMITDGEPTAHLVPAHGGDGYEVSSATRLSPRPCGRRSRRSPGALAPASPSTLSCSTPTAQLQGFVEQMTRLNRGQGVLHDTRDSRRLRARRLPRAPPKRPVFFEARRLNRATGASGRS